MAYSYLPYIATSNPGKLRDFSATASPQINTDSPVGLQRTFCRLSIAP
jgi:hypothetical protein